MLSDTEIWRKYTSGTEIWSPCVKSRILLVSDDMIILTLVFNAFENNNDRYQLDIFSEV